MAGITEHTAPGQVSYGRPSIPRLTPSPARPVATIFFSSSFKWIIILNHLTESWQSPFNGSYKLIAVIVLKNLRISVNNHIVLSRPFGKPQIIYSKVSVLMVGD